MQAVCWHVADKPSVARFHSAVQGLETTVRCTLIVCVCCARPPTAPQEEGWRRVYDAQGSPSYSPHYVSYIWAVYLWGYHVSEFPPLLERAQRALEIMMAGYPQKWIPTSNGIAMQRARILLPLAFLVR